MNKIGSLDRPDYVVRIPSQIVQTYILLSLSFGTYLIGAFITAPVYLSFVCMAMSFVMLFVVIATDHPISLMGFSFVIGLSHHQMFNYVNLIDPSIITEALAATLMVFIGLTYFAVKSPNYNAFRFYGIMYSALSTLIFVGILNLFIKNSVIELLSMYASIVIFSIYTIIDTQSMIERRHTPVQAATHLFLDFINLFLNLIKLLKNMKKKD